MREIAFQSNNKYMYGIDGMGLMEGKNNYFMDFFVFIYSFERRFEKKKQKKKNRSTINNNKMLIENQTVAINCINCLKIDKNGAKTIDEHDDKHLP